MYLFSLMGVQLVAAQTKLEKRVNLEHRNLTTARNILVETKDEAVRIFNRIKEEQMASAPMRYHSRCKDANSNIKMFILLIEKIKTTLCASNNEQVCKSRSQAIVECLDGSSSYDVNVKILKSYLTDITNNKNRLIASLNDLVYVQKAGANETDIADIIQNQLVVMDLKNKIKVAVSKFGKILCKSNVRHADGIGVGDYSGLLKECGAIISVGFLLDRMLRRQNRVWRQIEKDKRKYFHKSLTAITELYSIILSAIEYADQSIINMDSTTTGTAFLVELHVELRALFCDLKKTRRVLLA